MSDKLNKKISNILHCIDGNEEAIRVKLKDIESCLNSISRARRELFVLTEQDKTEGQGES